jgi:hypothetical protein
MMNGLRIGQLMAEKIGRKCLLLILYGMNRFMNSKC